MGQRGFGRPKSSAEAPPVALVMKSPVVIDAAVAKREELATERHEARRHVERLSASLKRRETEIAELDIQLKDLDAFLNLFYPGRKTNPTTTDGE